MFTYNKYLFGICLISYTISSYSMELSRPKDGAKIKMTYLSDAHLEAVENVNLNFSDYTTEDEDYTTEDEDDITQDTSIKELCAIFTLSEHFKKSVNKN